MAKCVQTARAAQLLKAMTWAALLLATSAGAAEPALLSESEFTAELPVVLTASRLTHPQSEAPAAVTVIDRQMIEGSGARNLSEVFRLVPGFLVGFFNGNAHVVTDHGLGDKFSPRLQVLVDGRSVYLPSFGGVSWSDIPLALDDIERIEVIRGPNAVTYGANAFLATINVITRHSAADPGGFVRTTAGSNHIRDGAMRAAGGDGDLHYRLTAGYQEDNGYAQINDSRVIREIQGRMDYNHDRHDAEFQFGYNEGPRGVGIAGSLSNYPRDEQITSRFEQFRYHYHLADGGDLGLQAYHVHHEWDDAYNTLPIPLPPPFPPGATIVIPVNIGVRSDRYDVELQHTLAAMGPVRMVWGVGGRQDENLSPGYLGTSKTAVDHLYRVFANVEWHATSDLMMNAGAMYEKYDITGADISPRLAVNYHLSPAATLRAVASRADRLPVAFEEQSYERICVNPTCTIFNQIFLSSGQLRPERIDSAELGYLGRYGTTWTIDLRLFRDQVFDLISDYTRPYAPDVIDHETFDFRNGGKATMLGTEIQMQFQPQHSTRFVFNYANTQIKSNDYDAYYSLSVPRQNLGFLAMQDLPENWQTSLGFYYQDRMRYLDGDMLEPQRRLDWRLAWNFALAEARGQLALVLQNMWESQAAYRLETVSAQIGYLTFALHFR